MKAIRLLVSGAIVASLALAATAQQPTGTTVSTTSPAQTTASSSFQPSAGSGDSAVETPSVNPLDLQGVQKYLLGPGDVLDLRVFNEQQFSDKLQVTDEGNVEVPFIGAIPARCRTDVEVKKDITAALTKFLRNPQVSLRITEAKSRPPAVVFGAVRDPARVEMKRRVRLLELLAVTGGTTEQAGGDIQIFHTEAVMCPEREEQLVAENKQGIQGVEGAFTLYKLADLKIGKLEANPTIRPGDIVIVREAPPIYVTGAVNNPTGIYLREQLPLSRALAMVGGTKKGAKIDSVKIYRLKPNSSEQEIVTVDYAAIKKQKKPDVFLQAYDIVEVPDPGGFVYNVKEFLLKNSLPMAGQAFTNVPLRILY